MQSEDTIRTTTAYNTRPVVRRTHRLCDHRGRVADFGDGPSNDSDQNRHMEPDESSPPQRLAVEHSRTAGTASTSIKYSPLRRERGEIRVLKLLQDHADGPVRCSFATVSLYYRPKLKFSTISYFWGSKHITRVIYVDDRPIAVPKNAADALKRLRNDHAVVWIDSVCINQCDVQERGQQVAMMHRIYRASQHNLIWLGQDDGTIRAAMATLDALKAEFEMETSQSRSFRETVRDHDQRVLYAENGFSFSFHPEALFRFFARPWFHRLWVVQEAALSPVNTCYCGPFEFDLVDALRAAQWVYYKQFHLVMTAHLRRLFTRGLVVAANLCNFVDKTGFFHRRVPINPLLTLLENLSIFDCSDPKDRVYGLLGLYMHTSRTPYLPKLLKVDYGKTLAEVFQDAMRHVLGQGTDDAMAFLKRVNHRAPLEAASPEWPSWVPKWHEKWNKDTDERPLAAFFHADRGLLYNHNDIALHSECVTLQGMLIDGEELSDVDSVSGICGDASEIYDFMVNAFDMIRAHEKANDSTHLPEHLAATLIGGRTEFDRPSSEQDVHNFKALMHYRKEFGKMPPSRQSLSPYQSEEPCSAGVRAAALYQDGCWRACVRRRFFITSGGYIGIGPQTLRCGDHIAIFAGAGCPFVIRKTSRSFFSLVGHCYVHGNMYGEAVTRNRNRGSKMTTFSIC